MNFLQMSRVVKNGRILSEAAKREKKSRLHFTFFLQRDREREKTFPPCISKTVFRRKEEEFSGKVLISRFLLGVLREKE